LAIRSRIDRKPSSQAMPRKISLLNGEMSVIGVVLAALRTEVAHAISKSN
jgi:hypothetical protein